MDKFNVHEIIYDNIRRLKSSPKYNILNELTPSVDLSKSLNKRLISRKDKLIHLSRIFMRLRTMIKEVLESIHPEKGPYVMNIINALRYESDKRDTTNKLPLFG